LHPYFLFSLLQNNNSSTAQSSLVVTLDRGGFRENPANNVEYQDNYVLLGGSTAFGWHSSSNSTTLASYLAQALEARFINRNAPSWNSHQELIALAKYKEPYVASLSFSGSNDIVLGCANVENNIYEDTPESFRELETQLAQSQRPITILRFFKNWIKFYLPDTYAFLWKSKEILFSGPTDKKEYQVFSGCPLALNGIVDAFLQNQKTMRAISEGRGARHITILQPHIDFFLLEEESSNSFRRRFYDEIMLSDYCRGGGCLDLSVIDQSTIGIEMFDGHNIKKAVFSDPVHLLDKGVDLFGKKIAEFLLVQDF